MYTRRLNPPKGSFFLFGPRGTGKSTWTREYFAGATTINLLDESLYQLYLADVSQFAQRLGALPKGSWVVVDEVQRLPALLNEVHRAIEERKLKFVLLGSSARKLRRGGVNLLAGRAVHRTMYPFAPEELGSDFDLGHVLRYGSIPLIWEAPEPDDALQAYVQLYLKEEIFAEAVVRNLPGFARFIPVAALFHGQALNVSALARDAGIARTTLQDYVTILEDTLVAGRLPAFESRLRVREKRHPKLYFVDPGLVRAAKNARGELTAEERGPLLEGLVYMLLRFYRDERRICEEIFYWSPAEAHKTEVDFLLRRGAKYWAIEVKGTGKVREEHFRGLRAIAELRGVQRRIMVYLGKERMRTKEGIEILPFAEFAAELAAG